MRKIPPDAYKLPGQTCPWCNHRMTLASEVSLEKDRLAVKGSKPQPKDITMCIACGELAIFSDDLTLVRPSDDDLTEMGQDPRVQAMRQAWVRAKE